MDRAVLRAKCIGGDSDGWWVCTDAPTLKPEITIMSGDLRGPYLEEIYVLDGDVYRYKDTTK